MKNRCYNRSNPRYADWGGRGIRVCDRWLGRRTGFQNFVADMGKRPLGTQLDRKDNDGDYTPENCRWASTSENAYNRRQKRTNTSGVTGVIFNRRTNQWQAVITKEKKRYHLGWFDDFDSAVTERQKAETLYNTL